VSRPGRKSRLGKGGALRAKEKAFLRQPIKTPLILSADEEAKRASRAEATTKKGFFVFKATHKNKKTI
jgi:hypothetical protein